MTNQPEQRPEPQPAAEVDTSTTNHNITLVSVVTKANKDNCTHSTGDMIRVRCPYTGVWILKESEWVTLR